MKTLLNLYVLSLYCSIRANKDTQRQDTTELSLILPKNNCKPEQRVHLQNSLFPKGNKTCNHTSLARKYVIIVLLIIMWLFWLNKFNNDLSNIYIQNPEYNLHTEFTNDIIIL